MEHDLKMVHFFMLTLTLTRAMMIQFDRGHFDSTQSFELKTKIDPYLEVGHSKTKFLFRFVSLFWG